MFFLAEASLPSTNKLFNTGVTLTISLHTTTLASILKDLLSLSSAEIRWPRKISNEQLKNKIKYEEWTENIDKARIRWIGHLFRMSPETPARIAMEEAERSVKMPSGRQKQTWLKVAKEQIEKLNLNWDEAKKLAQDRDAWRDLMKA